MVCEVPEGYGASGNRGECSSERVCFRGNRDCRTQPERVPDTSTKARDKIQNINKSNKNYEKHKKDITNKQLVDDGPDRGWEAVSVSRSRVLLARAHRCNGRRRSGRVRACKQNPNLDKE